MSKMAEDFRKFVMRGNVLDLAVAVVIGVAFNAVVTSLVNDVIMQIIAVIVGKPNFNNLTFTINDGIIYYGKFLTALDQLPHHRGHAVRDHQGVRGDAEAPQGRRRGRRRGEERRGRPPQRDP